VSVDRELLLDRVDLVELFGEMVGPVRKEGAGWRAPCPDPAHGQTGKTPPVSIDPGRRLWNCHACPAQGTAIDVVMLAQGVSVGQAMVFLARRVGLDSGPPVPTRTAQPARPAPAKPQPVAAAARSELEAYVAHCADALWTPAGAEVLAWLRGRGLPDELLRSNRVGADPGKGLLRAAGLPKPALGATFPVLDQQGRAVYVQLRPLKPAPAKYLNPDTRIFGVNPRVAVTAAPQLDGGQVVFVCEGMPDALTAAAAGYRSVALLGTQAPDTLVAQRLVEEFPAELLVLALDADQAGQAATDHLADLLADAGAGRRVWKLSVPEAVAAEAKERDLNRWAVVAGDAFISQLHAAVEAASPAGWEPVPTAADLVTALLEELDDQAGGLAISTGFAGLDGLLANGGWRPGLVLMGGLPGIGKSAFALQVSLTAARAGHPVLYVSVEQSEKELLGRLFCRELEVPIAAFWNRQPGFAARARSAAERLPLEHLYVRSDPYIVGEDRQGTVGRVRRWAEEVLEVTGRRPLVVVDYLQRMRPPEADRRLDERLRISVAGLGLRQLARDLDLAVLVISSIGRGSYEGLPKLDWFKGSGDLEYDADACLILRPDSSQLPDLLAARLDIELHVVKNRYGRLTQEDPIGLFFDRRYGTFRQDPDRPGRAAAQVSLRR
jgi:replicative DNA helicase